MSIFIYYTVHQYLCYVQRVYYWRGFPFPTCEHVIILLSLLHLLLFTINQFANLCKTGAHVGILCIHCMVAVTHVCILFAYN